MLNKDKIIKAEVFDLQGRTLITTSHLQFPKDFFAVKDTEFVILKGRDIPHVDIGEQVDVIIHYMNGTRVKYTTQIDLATDMQLNFHVGTQYMVMEERRRYCKAETNTIGKVTLYVRGEEKVLFDEPLFVRIKNINLGGVLLISNHKFMVGDILMLSMLDLSNDISTEILRAENDEEGKLIGYGCRFLNLNLADEEAISRFIFECQVKQREKFKRMGK